MALFAYNRTAGTSGGGGGEGVVLAWRTDTFPLSADVVNGDTFMLGTTPSDNDAVLAFVDGIFYADLFSFSSTTATANYALALGGGATLTFKYPYVV